MTTYKTVALAGANGNIGAPVLKALLEANFTVTALTRPDSSHSFPSGVKTAKIDYNDPSSLQTALKGQDVLICTLGFAGIKSQEQLIDAAVAAGVKRIIPSEFGADPEDAAARNLPVFGQKAEVEAYLKQKVQGTQTSYSLIANNDFIDWTLDYKVSIDIAGKKAEIFDGGDVPYTASPLEFVARGVVGVLRHPDETANRTVRLHGASMTQNKLLGIIQDIVGKEGWNISHVSGEERMKQGYEGLQRDASDFMGWAIPMIQVATWGKGVAGDYSKNNDNEVLELKGLSEDDVEQIVKSRA